MFDIKDYFENEYGLSCIRRDFVNIDDDITHDINNLLSNRFNSLYRRDRYKHLDKRIEIIYPSLQYPGNSQLLMNPDKVRYLLSFYPQKSDFCHVDKIVMRPRYIEVGNIELVSLYLRRKRILVLYIFHPHFYKMKYAGAEGSDEDTYLDTLAVGRLINDTLLIDHDSDILVHPLWYLLSTIGHGNDEGIDKFFIKKEAVNDTMYEALNDVSFYYSRHGY